MMKKWMIAVCLMLYVLCGKADAQENLEQYMEELDIMSIQQSVDEMLPEEKLDIRELLVQLCKGELQPAGKMMQSIAENTLLSEIKKQRKNIARILILAIAASVFSSFFGVFTNSNVQEIAFYMIYLLLFVLLLKSFREMAELSGKTMKDILQFMKLLLPVYLLAASLASRQMTAVGFYEITLFLITVVQSLIQYIIMPGIYGYLLIAMLNNVTREAYLSRMMSFLKKGISVMMKSLFGLVLGIQTIQRILFPTLDTLKNSIWIKAGSAIPVIGNTLNSVTETLLGTAAVLKNAVGAAGMLILIYICIRPVLRLSMGLILYKLVSAVIQPVADRRFSECVDHMADGIALLLMAVSITGVLFFLTIAIVTTAGSGI